MEFDDGATLAADDDDLLSTWAGDRFFSASIFLLLLLTTLRSGTDFSRRAFFAAAVREELLELDEYDEPVSEPLESDEPVEAGNIDLDFLLEAKGIFKCLPEPEELERRFLRLFSLTGAVFRVTTGDD